MRRKVSVYRMLFWYGFFCVGANIAHSFTPKMFTDLGLPDYMFGVAFACMALMGLLTSPLWGKLSDQSGRVSMFAVGCVGYAVSQYLFCIAGTSIPIILARLLGGIFAAPMNVCSLAYLVDVTQPEERGRFMSYYAAITSVCVAGGYLLGGMLGDISVVLGFSVQILLLLLAAVGILLQVKDTSCSGEKKRKKIHFSEINPFAAMIDAKKVLTKRSLLFFVIILIVTFMSTAFDNNFNYYIRAELGFPTTYNGIIKAVIGVLGLAANFTINLWIARHTNQRKSLVWILAATAAVLAGIVLFDSVAVFVVLSIIGLILNAVHLPILQTLSTSDSEGASNGILAGLFNSFRSIGQVIGSLFAGFIYAYGGKLPFLSAGIACLLAVLLGMINIRQYRDIEN